MDGRPCARYAAEDLRQQQRGPSNVEGPLTTTLRSWSTTQRGYQCNLPGKSDCIKLHSNT
eukprot:10479778-Heterocapsa_arctica.AAC.1